MWSHHEILASFSHAVSPVFLVDDSIVSLSLLEVALPLHLYRKAVLNSSYCITSLPTLLDYHHYPYHPYLNHTALCALLKVKTPYCITSHHTYIALPLTTLAALLPYHPYCITPTLTALLPPLLHYSHPYCTTPTLTALLPPLLHYSHPYCTTPTLTALLLPLLHYLLIPPLLHYSSPHPYCITPLPLLLRITSLYNPYCLLYYSLTTYCITLTPLPPLLYLYCITSLPPLLYTLLPPVLH